MFGDASSGGLDPLTRGLVEGAVSLNHRSAKCLASHGVLCLPRVVSLPDSREGLEATRVGALATILQFISSAQARPAAFDAVEEGRVRDRGPHAMSVRDVSPGLLRVTTSRAALVATVGGQSPVGAPRPTLEASPFVPVSLPTMAAAVLRLLVRTGRRLPHEIAWSRRKLVHGDRDSAGHEGEALDVVLEGGTCLFRGLRVGQNGALRCQVRLRIATNEPLLMVVASGIDTPVRLSPIAGSAHAAAFAGLPPSAAS